MTTATLRSTAESNRVLSNALALLAISIVPTIFGAGISVYFGLAGFLLASPWISVGAFLILAFGLLFLISANRDSALGVAFMLTLTLVLGVWLGPILSLVMTLDNAFSLIGTAGLGTAIAVFTTSAYATTTKRDFSGLGGWLLGAVIGLIAIGILNLFLTIPLLSVGLSAAALLIFSAFMVYDVQRIVNGGETNYILAATSLYINIYNIFSSLLQLLYAFSGND
jgi:modulator of FtsH protease